MPQKISKDQVPLKIHSGVDAFQNIIMKIPLKVSARENLHLVLFKALPQYGRPGNLSMQYVWIVTLIHKTNNFFWGGRGSG